MKRVTPRTLGIYGIIIMVAVLVVVIEGQTNRRGAQEAGGLSARATDAPAEPQRNPLRVDTQTVLAGQQLYRSYCASCHGTSGRGDGPAAASLGAPVGDLVVQMQPGRTTDAAVFRWIANSAPDSSMPAFGDKLSEEQIWQLVSYLRTFKPALAATTPTAGAAAASATAAPSGDLSLPLPPAVADAPEPLPPLVFARNGNIWRSDGSDAKPVQVTQLDSQEYAGQPAYAPGIGRVAFVTVSPPPITSTSPLPSGALYTMNLDGSDRQLVWSAPEGTFSLPAWTPDGSALFVMYNGVAEEGQGQDWRPRIVRVELASGARDVVVEEALDPTLSPDGSRLAYLRLHEDDYTISLVVANPDGSDAREVVDGASFSSLFAPRFSPDGQRLLVAAVDGPETDDQGFPITSSHAPVLDDLLGWLAPPVAEAHGAPWDLWLVNVDGSGLRRLTYIYEDLPLAIFTPEADEIVMMGYGGFYRMGPDGSNLRRISPLGDHGGMDWIR